jgi:hypothetical protein
VVGREDWRGCPGAVGDELLGPVGAQVQGEVGRWGWEPVVVAVVSGWLLLDIEGEGAVLVQAKVLVLGAERVAAELVGVEEVVLVAGSAARTR